MKIVRNIPRQTVRKKIWKMIDKIIKATKDAKTKLGG